MLCLMLNTWRINTTRRITHVLGPPVIPRRCNIPFLVLSQRLGVFQFGALGLSVWEQWLTLVGWMYISDETSVVWRTQVWTEWPRPVVTCLYSGHVMVALTTLKLSYKLSVCSNYHMVTWDQAETNNGLDNHIWPLSDSWPRGSWSRPILVRILNPLVQSRLFS